MRDSSELLKRMNDCWQAYMHIGMQAYRHTGMRASTSADDILFFMVAVIGELPVIAAQWHLMLLVLLNDVYNKFNSSFVADSLFMCIF